MKRLSMFVVVLVLLAAMVSSVVRASGDPTSGEPDSRGTVSVMNGDPDDPAAMVHSVVRAESDPIDLTPKASGAVTADDAIIAPPTMPNAETSSPVGSDHIVISPPTDPDSKATPILF